MKILIVDDNASFVEFATENLRIAGLDVDGILALQNMRTIDDRPLSEEAELALVRNADVIFLDHNMPRMTGDVRLAYWKRKGIDFAGKRVVSVSSDRQTYLNEWFDPMNLHNPNRVKEFLDL